MHIKKDNQRDLCYHFTYMGGVTKVHNMLNLPTLNNESDIKLLLQSVGEDVFISTNLHYCKLLRCSNQIIVLLYTLDKIYDVRQHVLALVLRSGKILQPNEWGYGTLSKINDNLNPRKYTWSPYKGEKPQPIKPSYLIMSRSINMKFFSDRCALVYYLENATDELSVAFMEVNKEVLKGDYPIDQICDYLDNNIGVCLGMLFTDVNNNKVLELNLMSLPEESK